VQIQRDGPVLHVTHVEPDRLVVGQVRSATGDNGLITQVTPMRDLRQWENGGYFLRPGIFDMLNEGEDLVEDAIMRRLVPQSRVLAYPNKGYWSPADTVKERAQLEDWRRCTTAATAPG
jgi:glucose-1-phosphate cytidylyltransferase